MKLCWLIADGDLAWHNPLQKPWEISNTGAESRPLHRAWVVIKTLHLLQREMLPGWGQVSAITAFRDQGVVSEGTFFKRCLMRGGKFQSSAFSSADIWERHPRCGSAIAGHGDIEQGDGDPASSHHGVFVMLF